MKYHLDTIPVWDAFKQDSECPLCDLKAKVEADYLDSFLGASVMEPAVRIEVNQKGFCARHFALMLPMKNRLGLALITHTHMLEKMKADLPAPPKKKGLFSRSEAPAETEEKETCIICERMKNTMDRYYYTAVKLFETDSDFRKKFLESKGLCMPHAKELIRMAGETLSAEKAKDFAAQLQALQQKNLERVEKELFWFTQKFDYRNADKPWGNSKDAPERAILKLRGRQ